MMRKTTLHVLWCIGLLAISLPAGAQTATVITGRVTDPQGAAIVGAQVRLYERDGRIRLSTRTDEAGQYQFERLAAGPYLLEIEAEGFARVLRNVRVKKGDSLTVDVQLEVGRVRAEVIVTASATAQSVDETSKAITVVNAEEIQNRDEFSIGESIRRTPGLRVQQLGGPGALTKIKIRGLRNQDTAVLIDGFRFRDAATIQGDATSFLEDLLVVNPERVEVLRGSGSSLYGTNAIGGVINIVTDRGGGPTHGQLQLEGGMLDLFRGRGQVAGGLGRDRFQYSAAVTHLNVAGGIDGNDATRHISGQGFAEVNLTPTISVSGRIWAADSFLQLNDSPFAAPGATLPPRGPVPAIPLPPAERRRLEAGQSFNVGGATFVPDVDDPDSRRTADFFAGAVVFSQRLGEAASYRLSFQHVATDRTFRDGPAGVRFEPSFGTQSDFQGRIDTLNLRADLWLGRWNLLSAGYEYERETFTNISRDENPDPANRVLARSHIKQRSHTVFVQDQLPLLDRRLQISLAGRVQAFDLSRPEFVGGTTRFTEVPLQDPQTAYTGDASIAYTVAATETKLRAHVGNGYHAPSLFERFGASFFFGTFFLFGDPRLRPERSIAFDVGVDQSLAGGRLYLSTTYFYTRLQEVIAFDSSGLINPATDPFGRSSGYLNTGGGLARGVEVSIEGRPTAALDFSLSYTYTNADERVPSILDFPKTLEISDHMVTLIVNQRLARRIHLTFDLFAASDYAFPFFAGDRSRAFIFDGPVKADLGVSYTLPLSEARSLRFYTKVDNIFDDAYFEDGFRTPGATWSGGVTLRF